MHLLKKMIWNELKAIEMDESKKMETDPKRTIFYENVITVKDLAKAYVYLHKACEIHHEHHMDEADKTEEKKSKIFD